MSFNDDAEFFEPKDDGKFVLLFYESTLHLRDRIWGHAPDYALKQILICQNKVLRIICCRPPNSSITNEFKNLKIMPISLLFKYRSLIFFNQMLTNDSELKQSLIINHEQSTRLNQDALKLPKIKTEKGRRSMFYFSAQLYNRLAWEFTDCPAKAFRERLAARLWDEDWAAEH